eukprot:2144328-Amphidinium_carterae.1
MKKIEIKRFENYARLAHFRSVKAPAGVKLGSSARNASQPYLSTLVSGHSDHVQTLTKKI